MTRSPLPIRPDLSSVAPYVSPQLPARYRMNTNETPYPPPEALVAEVAGAITSVALNRYPDRDANDLFDALSRHVAWPREGLWVANGSNEVFMHLFLGFGGGSRSALLFEPTYALHSLIPRIGNTKVLQLERDDDFAIDVESALKTIERDRPEIVIVCSPNNPTGMCEPIETVVAIAEAAPGLVVVDEAYMEFTDPAKSVRGLLDRHPNMVLVKTFSKAWRLAGVRIGYMLASPALIEELARVRLPYHLSAITQLVGVAALGHAEETLRLVHAIARERERISEGLHDMGVHHYPSDANFVLFDVADAQRVWQGLLDRGVLVRNYRSHPRLAECLRVTAGLPEETDAFLQAMKDVVA